LKRAAILIALSLFACRKKAEEIVVVAPEVTTPRSPRAGSSQSKPGMVWIPAGTLQAGTPPASMPRLADEEMPGTPMDMGAFYIDEYPFPNEPGAIPTTNVSREDAAKLCANKGKRLCTELEWERACKGPDNTTYEYGAQYNKEVCNTGIPSERASRRPNGERAACRSAFGVFDLHGGSAEWTESTWSRRHGEAELGVVRGGNARAGELVGRCANGSGKPTKSKFPTVGFRCCAGARNDATVILPPSTLPMFERKPDREVATITEPFAAFTTNLWGSKATLSADYAFERVWYWRPVSNEELVIAVGCEKDGGPWSHCGALIARVVDGKATLLAQFATGPHVPDLIAKDSEPKQVRARGIDVRGTFARDFEYVNGRIRVAEEARP
jgi:formylglycine-generating enzyme